MLHNTDNASHHWHRKNNNYFPDKPSSKLEWQKKNVIVLFHPIWRMTFAMLNIMCANDRFMRNIWRWCDGCDAISRLDANVYRVIFVRYVNYIIVCYHRRDMIKLCIKMPCVCDAQLFSMHPPPQMTCSILYCYSNWSEIEKTNNARTRKKRKLPMYVWQIYYFVRVRLNCTNECVRLERMEYEAGYGRR